MKLRITDELWAVGCSTKRVARKDFPCVVGPLEGIGNERRFFTIDAVSADTVTVSMHCANASSDKTWIVTKEQGVFHRPLSMDGGHQFTIQLRK